MAGGLAPFAGWVLAYDKPILLVLEDQSHLETAVRYLIRLGYDRIQGYLKGGSRVSTMPDSLLSTCNF